MKQWINVEWERQRHNLILWCPVVFGCGIYLYFSFPFEPSFLIISALVLILAGVLVPMVLARGFLRIATIILMLLITGYLSATYRSFSVAAPVLEFRYYGPVEGRIIKIDKSSSQAWRVLLDRVVMTEMRPTRTPERVRVSLFGYLPDGILAIGNRVTLVANMSPPGAPAEPGGFDYRMIAWFDQIGAVGFSRTPLLEMRPYGDNGRRLDRLRADISGFVANSIGGQNGAFSAAILTGERSRIDQTILAQLRASNLAHLLAISGLHMGLLTGFVYLIVRYGLATIPRIALYLPIKKLGAMAALLVGLGYLFVSGGSVATQRAFIMVAVVLIAVMLDRPAFTLRAVALAAMIVLIVRPESLNEAGFQMSFAATTALIGVFEILRRKTWWREARYGRLARFMPFIALIITSSVAGLATAPISAFHFNQLAKFGLMANLLSVPVMGLLVMPAAVVAGVLFAFGLSDPAFWVMGQGVGWILGVADFFATLPGAVIPVKSAAPMVLPMVVFAGCLFFLVQGVLRFSGFFLLIIAIGIWQQTSRPDVLIDENGALLGVMIDGQRVLNKETAYRFSAGSWLENDGDLASQQEAFQRAGFTVEGSQTRAILENGWQVVLERSKPGGFADGFSCVENQIFIAPKWPDPPMGSCVFIGQSSFENGAMAIYFDNGFPEIRHAAPDFPLRPWNNGGRPYQ